MYDWNGKYRTVRIMIYENSACVYTSKLKIWAFVWSKGTLVACWLKCWPAIERLQVQAPLGSGFLSPMSVLNSAFRNEEVFITASFGGDVKPLVPRSWLILATCGILASSLATFGQNTFRKKRVNGNNILVVTQVGTCTNCTQTEIIMFCW